MSSSTADSSADIQVIAPDADFQNPGTDKSTPIEPYLLPSKAEYIARQLSIVKPPSDEPACPICGDDWKPEEKKVITVGSICRHVFHEECLLAWFDTGALSNCNTCPTCRRKLWKQDLVGSLSSRGLSRYRSVHWHQAARHRALRLYTYAMREQMAIIESLGPRGSFTNVYQSMTTTLLSQLDAMYNEFPLRSISWNIYLLSLFIRMNDDLMNDQQWLESTALLRALQHQAYHTAPILPFAEFCFTIHLDVRRAWILAACIADRVVNSGLVCTERNSAGEVTRSTRLDTIERGGNEALGLQIDSLSNYYVEEHPHELGNIFYVETLEKCMPSIVGVVVDGGRDRIVFTHRDGKTIEFVLSYAGHIRGVQVPTAGM